MRSPFAPTPITSAVLLLAVVCSGCSSLSDSLSGSKLDYRAQAQQTQGLEVPPDLTQLAREGRYQPPGAVVSAATAGTAATSTAAPGATVAPASLGGMKIVREGDLRWLLVPMPPEQLWPQLQAFWAESGFKLTLDDARVGVMETDWAENRAKLPQDAIRATLGRLIENLMDTGERDRYRTRIERTDKGTEVHITHRGLQEVAGGDQKDNFRWVARPADASLEAEFLKRLMVRLGSAEAVARTELAAPAANAPARARLLTGQVTPAIEVDDNFDRTWRRVGLALDRSGFTVEDRNRNEGVYFVRYVDSKAADERGFLARIFSSDTEAAKAQRFRIALLGGAGAGASKSVVAVQNAEGGPVSADVGQRIANVLLSELK